MNSRFATVVRIQLACALILGVMIVGPAHAEEYFKSYSVPGRANVQIQARWGSVRVTTAASSQVGFHVTYDRRDWSPDPPIESHQDGNLVALRSRIDDRDHEPSGEGWWGWWHWWDRDNHRRLSIEVQMPKDADLQLQTTDGAVEVAAVNGNVFIRTTNGTIFAAYLSGALDIVSTNGAIELDSLKGTMRVRTTNGPISASHLDGKSDLATTNGGVRVEGRFDTLDIRSTNGGVVARAESGSRMTSSWRVQTTNGHVDLAVPQDLKADLNVDTHNGRIRLDLPFATRVYDDGHSVHGSLNGGGPEIGLSTTNAGIHVSGI